MSDVPKTLTEIRHMLLDGAITDRRVDIALQLAYNLAVTDLANDRITELRGKLQTLRAEPTWKRPEYPEFRAHER